jgi:hypothetical protein
MLDLTKLTFEELVAQFKNLVQSKNAWKDARMSSTGTMLIELCAYIPQILGYYLKRTYEEMFVDTAQYWESLTHLCKMLEIYVKRPIGACGEVKLIPKSPLGTSVILPKFTKLWCEDAEFYLAEDTVISPSDPYKVASVRQGIRTLAQFNSDGNSLAQQYKISNDMTTDVDIVVKAGDTNYTVVTHFMESLDANQVRVFTDIDKSLVVHFSRGFGLPLYGQTISVYYILVDPDYVPSVSASWTIDDSRFDVEPVLPFTSGAGYEDVETFRERCSKFFGVGKRAVTKEDFWYVVMSVPGVEDVMVLDVKDNFAAPFKSVDIYVKGAGGVFTDTLKNQIQTILTQMGSVGVDYRLFKAPSYDVDVYSVLYTGRYAISSAIRTEALSRIENLFKSAKIGQWIYRNEIIAELESIKDVKRVLLVTPSVDVQLTTQVPNLRSTRVDVVGA